MTCTPWQVKTAEAPVTKAASRVTLPEDRSSWLVLGIESSCDDTGAAVLRGDGTILAEVPGNAADAKLKLSTMLCNDTPTAFSGRRKTP